MTVQNLVADRAAVRSPNAVGQRVLPAIALLAVLAALPFVFDSGMMLSLLCQIGIMAVFALSYNILLGQTGLLSFGHAVYFGLGAFATLHALNAFGDAFPVTLLPLIGALAGLVSGVVLGYVTTKRAGSTFAMISLGIGELVAASALMLPFFFGGEGGISGDRVTGTGWFGINYASQTQMYFLITGWALVSAVLMHALTQTPLGRMANAVRDNAERAQFVGYDPQRVRFLMVVQAGFFAGLAGGLMAINYEIVTAEALGAHTSGAVLLMTFVGGAGFFYGPIIGAVLVTLMRIAVGSVSEAWLFYFGVFFVVMVLHAPGGIASLVSVQYRLWRARLLGPLLGHYLGFAAALLLTLLGTIGIVEMWYHTLSPTGSGAALNLLGLNLDSSSPTPWGVAVLVMLAGLLAVRGALARMAEPWHLALATLHKEGA